MILILIAIGDWWGGVCKWLHKRGRAHSDIGSHLSFGSRFKGLRHHKWASLDLWQHTCFWGHFCIISLVVFTIVLTTIIKCITSSTTSSSFPTCVTSSVAWLGTWSSSWSELSGVSGNIRELFSTWKFSVLLVAQVYMITLFVQFSQARKLRPEHLKASRLKPFAIAVIIWGRISWECHWVRTHFKRWVDIP